MDGQDRIHSVWAFTMIDDDGSEGIISMTLPGLGTTPLLGADLARVESLRPYAQKVATQLGKPVTLSHYSVRTDQEVILP